jgi:AcrR family transcriptional regulator
MTTRQQQKANTARRIFEAALRLFHERGFAATTVEQITRAAGVAKGTFFVHFASKEAVLEHIGRLQMDRLYAAFSDNAAFEAQPARARLHAVVAALARGIEAQPAEMRTLAVELLARMSLLSIDRQGIGELDALFERIVAAGQARGEMLGGEPPARLALLVRNAYFSAFFEWVQGDGQSLAALAARYLDLVLDGIGPQS